jgi:sulfur carrier protein ThiS
MKKLTALLFFVAMLQVASFGQEASTKEKLAQVKETTVKELVSKLQFTPEKAEKVVEIETEFYKHTAELAADERITTSQREAKLHKLHVTRRAKLTEANLSGRELEDAIDVVSSVRQKYKIQ